MARSKKATTKTLNTTMFPDVIYVTNRNPDEGLMAYNQRELELVEETVEMATYQRVVEGRLEVKREFLSKEDIELRDKG